MTSDDPTLVRYYELVEAHAGGARPANVRRPRPRRDWRPRRRSCVERADIVPVVLPAAIAARLHALNFRTWRQNPFIVGNVDAAELDRLGEALDALATGAREAAPVRWRMAQVILRKR